MSLLALTVRLALLKLRFLAPPLLVVVRPRRALIYIVALLALVVNFQQEGNVEALRSLPLHNMLASQGSPADQPARAWAGKTGLG